MAFFEFQTKFPTEKAAADYFFETRYHNELTCPHCGAAVKVYRDRKRAKVCHCGSRGNSFSPFSDMIFEKSGAVLSWAKPVVPKTHKTIKKQPLLTVFLPGVRHRFTD
jgi:hypothetical protein